MSKHASISKPHRIHLRAQVLDNVTVFSSYRTQQPFAFVRAIGQLTAKEAEAFLAASDRLIYILRDGTISNEDQLNDIETD